MPANDGKNISLLLIDDHTLLREALCEALATEGDFLVVGDTPYCDDIMPMAARARPDVILVDIDMSCWEPAHVVGRLLSGSPRSRVIVMSLRVDFYLVQRMLAAGAAGYLHKSVGRHEVLRSIRTVHEGRTVVMGTFRTSRDGPTAPRETTSVQLSEREREILGLVAQARSNRQIAAQLRIAEGTVKRHMRNIFAKLGAVSRIDAVNKAAGASQIVPATPARPVQGHQIHQPRHTRVRAG